MRWVFRIVVVIALFFGVVFLFNASWFTPPNPDGSTRLIAHRGVHQAFSRDGLTNDTCTASRIFPPTADLLENTVASAEAAFRYGADVVEFDIAPTSDGQLAVFHDWTVDCRTEGHGETRNLSLAELQALDIGYGYTADDGQTFPFRGRGIGLMPDFADMLSSQGTGRFLVNFKSNDAEEADMLAAALDGHEDWRDRLWSAYGGQAPVDRINDLFPGIGAFGSRQAMGCLKDYALTGWTGAVPDSCRNTKIMVPANYAFLLWGWPHLFTERMRKAGSEVILIGPIELPAVGTTGIDSIEQLTIVPERFDGYVWTNRIEIIGPALHDAS